MRKSNGSSTDPWGTPERTDGESDSSPSTTTDICLLVRKARIQELTVPVTPQEANLPRSRSWGTVSKARLKSSIPTSTCVRLSKDLKRSLRVIRSCVSQEWPLRNPCWAWVRTLFSSRKFKICRHTYVLVSCMQLRWGRPVGNSLGCARPPFYKLQASSPQVELELRGTGCIKQLGMGPVHVLVPWVFCSVNDQGLMLYEASVVKVILHPIWLDLNRCYFTGDLPSQGITETFSTVKMLQNSCSSNLALSLALVNSLPLTLRTGTPKLSWRRDFR